MSNRSDKEYKQAYVLKLKKAGYKDDQIDEIIAELEQVLSQEDLKKFVERKRFLYK